jgi:cytidine deaminase
MRIRHLSISFEEYDSREDLNGSDRELLNRAMESCENAYPPYSSFHVGAAVRLSGGLIITGNNQENAAYPSGLCAERVALFYAQAQYPDVAVEAIAIYARPTGFTLKHPVTPCGACRQVIAEYEHRHGNKTRIIMGNGDGAVQVVEGAEALLPLMFYLEELKKR